MPFHVVTMSSFVKNCGGTVFCCNEVTMLISWRQPEVFGLEFCAPGIDVVLEMETITNQLHLCHFWAVFVRLHLLGFCANLLRWHASS